MRTTAVENMTRLMEDQTPVSFDLLRTPRELADNAMLRDIFDRGVVFGVSTKGNEVLVSYSPNRKKVFNEINDHSFSCSSELEAFEWKQRLKTRGINPRPL